MIEKKEKKEVTETQLTTYVVNPEIDTISSDTRSDTSETIIEERKAIYTIPPHGPIDVARETKFVERRHSPSPHRRHHHHRHPEAIIIDGGRPREYIERSDPVPVGPLALAVPERPRRDERAIRAEIRALEAEKEALRAEKRRSGHNELVVFENDRIDRDDEVLVLKKEKIIEPEGGVRIEKDRKGRMSISVPKYLR